MKTIIIILSLIASIPSLYGEEVKISSFYEVGFGKAFIKKIIFKKDTTRKIKGRPAPKWMAAKDKNTPIGDCISIDYWSWPNGEIKTLEEKFEKLAGYKVEIELKVVAFETITALGLPQMGDEIPEDVKNWMPEAAEFKISRKLVILKIDNSQK